MIKKASIGYFAWLEIVLAYSLKCDPKRLFSLHTASFGQIKFEIPRIDFTDMFTQSFYANRSQKQRNDNQVTMSQFHQRLMRAFFVQNLAPKITKLCFVCEFFGCQNIGTKFAFKILMKLTTVLFALLGSARTKTAH